ncbi:hypothetical protein FRX31_004450 [Thalictrum thalictroides]|uniref:Uncharacterized protein n=1 Tax=Thalictrum thalictroides TaxID=46969 RepID=A0A7J6XBY0_THATH|nr:hypothetical protein FRX31_004450 [Thalictrum thalictroides]
MDFNAKSLGVQTHLFVHKPNREGTNMVACFGNSKDDGFCPNSCTKHFMHDGSTTSICPGSLHVAQLKQPSGELHSGVHSSMFHNHQKWSSFVRVYVSQLQLDQGVVGLNRLDEELDK